MTAEAAAEALGELLGARPEVLVILGSGLSGLAREATGPVVAFDEVGGLPGAGVAGHAGHWALDDWEGRPVLLQAGRFHAYEGHPMDVVVAPVRIAAGLGVGTVVVTNAAGGIARGAEPGRIMLLDDHINLMWRSPLAGPVRPGEARFPDMSAPYDPALQAAALDAATDLAVPLLRGTYAAVLGPSYETPAEVAMLARLGADAVGMSTVPEVTTAAALGLRVLGFSMITNRAAGLGEGETSHDEVMEVGRRAGATLGRLVRETVSRIPASA